jgi:hippurate hydrolase
MDALDILEDNNKPYVSKTSGKMHGCGHDGHTACLLGAAKYLSENRNFDGRVHLIFQPAEEGFGGAHKMIEEGLFKRFPMDSVYGLHNWPKIPRGKIAMRSGPIMAAADRFDIAIKGAGGHAAMPHRSIDPIIIGSQIVSALQTLVSRTRDPLDPVVISITNFNAGTGAFNVIPETAKLSGTLRSFNPDTRALMIKRIEEMCRDTAALYGASATCVFAAGGYDPTINTPAETEACAAVCKAIFGDENVDTDVAPSMGAEDFGAMLQQVPGCYIWMGQGEDYAASNHNQGLHTPAYDFNDEIIPMAMEYWVRVVEAALPLQK